MLKNLCIKAAQNKNIVMLITALFYIAALYGTLSGNVLLFSVLITGFSLLCIFKDLFPLKYVLVWFLIFYFGIANTVLRIKDTDELLNLAPVNSEISGTILTIPQGVTENKPKFFFKVNEIKFGSVKKEFKNEKALVTVNYDKEHPIDYNNLKLYNSLKLTGRLSIPFKAGNPSQFDYGNYLRNHNAYAVFYAKNVEKINKPLSLKARFIQRVNNYREKIIKLHSNYLPSPNLEILGGIVFGDDAVSPPQDIKQSFINSGLLHILAASGMNVAFIYSFFFILMSLLRVKFKLKVGLGMLMVVIYSMMTGLGASVIRATCMLLFVLTGKLIDRDAHSISLLSFVALLMLVYNPLWINDVGFQLSFVVTLGILVMAPALTRFKNKIINFIVSSVTIPIIAQLWVIPIQIFYFNNISLYSVFANIMSVPILMILSFGGFVSSLLSAITPISHIICKLFDFVLNPLITLLVNISDFWGRMPYSSLQTSHPAILQILIYYCALLAFSSLLYKELREKYFKKALFVSLFLLILLLITVIPIKNTNVEITAFDVGNADCFLIKTPDNKYIMVDTAKSGYNGGKSQAEIIVIKYLKDNGIKNLDSIIITHFDNDHCGGAADLIKNLKVKQIFVNELNHNSNAANEIYKTAKENSTNVVLVQNEQKVYENLGLKLVNYKSYEGKSDNDNSIISLLTYKDFSMLFTGDAGVDGINSVLKNLPKNISVLKVPHHGAIGGLNKTIVKYLNPDYSLISTGENKFGHPALYTLKLLSGSIVLRTDVDNSIRFMINQKGVKVLTYNIKERKYKKLEK